MTGNIMQNRENLDEPQSTPSTGSIELDISNTEEHTPELLTFPLAFKKVVPLGSSFLLSRSAIAIYFLGNGFVFAALGENAAAAGPYITTISTAVNGIPRGILRATAIQVAAAAGEGKPHLIGNINRAGIVLAVLMSVPMWVLLLNSGRILISLGVDPEVANEVDQFNIGASPGVLFNLWFSNDLSTAGGMQKKETLLIGGFTYIGFSMLVGYPLGLLTNLKMLGMGIGLSAGSFISAGIVRGYLWSQSDVRKFLDYGKWNAKEIVTGIKKTLWMGWAMGFQNFAEWSDLLGRSVVGGIIGERDSLAIEASLIFVAIQATMQMAVGQATMITIAHAKGVMKKHLEEGQTRAAQIELCNMKRCTQANLLFGLCIASLMFILLVSAKDPIIKTFTDESESDPELKKLTENMLITNAASFFPDAFRIIASSMLQGVKDLFFPPAASFTCMTLISLPVSAVLSLKEGASANFLFIFRIIGIMMANVLVTMRCVSKYKELKHSTTLPSLMVEGVEVTSSPQSALQQPPKTSAGLLGRFGFLNGKGGASETRQVTPR
jgi:MATE family multidrug resistance protein